MSFSVPEFSGIAIPAMAVGGLVGVVGVLIGVQCGGLDQCFAGKAPETVAVAAPLEVAEAAEPPEARLAPDPIVVATAEPPLSAAATKSQQINEVIGGSFAALQANDQGWLQSAKAVAIAPEPAPIVTEQGDGPGPMAVADASTPGANGWTAAQAATAVAEAPVVPLDRPEPLEVSAYAGTPRTAPTVSAEAQETLEQVANATAEPEPEAKPVKVAEAEPAAETSGALRTVKGAGVNVRSGPGKSNDKLFALAGGEKVKVVEDRRGWLKITDDQNRTGWVYKDYLS